MKTFEKLDGISPQVTRARKAKQYFISKEQTRQLG
jgi:hypothetical protein